MKIENNKIQLLKIIDKFYEEWDRKNNNSNNSNSTKK